MWFDKVYGGLTDTALLITGGAGAIVVGPMGRGRNAGWHMEQAFMQRQQRIEEAMAEGPLFEARF